MSDSADLDPRKARRDPLTESILRQWMRNGSAGYTTDLYRRWMDFHQWPEEKKRQFLDFKEATGLGMNEAYEKFFRPQETEPGGTHRQESSE